MRRLLSLVVLVLLTQIVFSQDVKYSLEELPFSRFGSYLAMSVEKNKTTGQKNLYLREVSGKYAWITDNIFKIEVFKSGNLLPFDSIVGSPSLLKCYANGFYLDFCFDGLSTIRMIGDVPVIRITKVMDAVMNREWVMPVNDKQYRIHGAFDKYALTAIKGKLIKLQGEQFVRETKPVNVPWAQFEIVSTDEGCEVAMERYLGGWNPHDYPKSFGECEKEVRADFVKFTKGYPNVGEMFETSKNIASYANWSAVVSPRGFLTRNTMFMSKSLMRHVFSWDHCFNAMALAPGNPDLAWDQFALFFDIQDSTGALLDYANDYQVQIDFTKPPIHGLYLRQLMSYPGLVTQKRMEEVYKPLSKWTNFWFDYCDDNKDGLPAYLHGNDSGWDNCTVFDVGYPVKSPDLAAYLIIQMDVLSEIATKLNKPDDAKKWKIRADALLETMIKKLWNGKAFVFLRANDGISNLQSQSLMPYLPMILGNRLPENIRKTIVGNFRKSGLITPFGPATESPKSPLYQEDGYWRGPIWAPSTYIIVEGLKNCGEPELARELALGFCKACDKSGFRENFVATNGEGLRDYGYTWTSSVFIMLAHDYYISSLKTKP